MVYRIPPRRIPKRPVIHSRPTRLDFYSEFTSGVPTEFTEIEGGTGTVSVASNTLIVDTGGTTTSDYAAAVFNTPINRTSLTIMAAEVKLQGDNIGAYVPHIMSLVEGSTEPGADTQANWIASNRFYWQDQRSATDSSDRCMLKYRNKADTEYQWSNSGQNWTTAFQYSLPDIIENSYYVFVFVYDGTVSPARIRGLVLGYENKGAGSSAAGRQTYWDTDWADFTDASQAAGALIQNDGDDLWFVLGSPVNDSNTVDITYTYRRVMVGEIQQGNYDQFSWTNRGHTTNFPRPYDIYLNLNPCPDKQTLWIPRDQTDTNPVVAKGSEVWVKDPQVYWDEYTGKYWMVFQVRKTSDSKSYINVVETTDVLNGTWKNQTEIVAPSASQNKVEFPKLFREPGGGDWWLSYNEESTTTQWKSWINSSSAATPTSGWGTATETLDVSGGADWKDAGNGQHHLLWVDGAFTTGTWAMFYGANDDSPNYDWRSNYASSTSGPDATYTDNTTGDPVIDVETHSTTLSSDAFDTNQITVSSTTGFTAGDTIYFGTNTYGLYYVVSVDNSTQMTLQAQVYRTNTTAVGSWYRHSNSVNYLKKINGIWYAWLTSFKYTEETEYVGVYVGTGGKNDPRNETWRALRTTDYVDNNYLGYWGVTVPGDNINYFSDENIGFITTELTTTGTDVVGAVVQDLIGMGILPYKR